MRKLLFLLPVVSLVACSSPVGGPCTYETDTVSAVIVKMDSTNSPYPDIWLTVPTNNGTGDTIRYTNNTNESPTWETCAERGYSVGAKLKCIRDVRTAGECDPVIFRLTKEVVK